MQFSTDLAAYTMKAIQKAGLPATRELPLVEAKALADFKAALKMYGRTNMADVVHQQVVNGIRNAAQERRVAQMLYPNLLKETTMEAIRKAGMPAFKGIEVVDPGKLATFKRELSAFTPNSLAERVHCQVVRGIAKWHRAANRVTPFTA